MHAHTHVSLCLNAYVGQGLFRTKKRKVKSFFMIFLTLLLSHSVFCSSHFLSAVSPSFSECLTYYPPCYLLPSLALHPSSRTFSLQLPSLRIWQERTWNGFLSSPRPCFLLLLFCFLCHHYPGFWGCVWTFIQCFYPSILALSKGLRVWERFL